MQVVKNKIDRLAQEMERLLNEQQQIRVRSNEITTRINQVLGAIQALQECLAEHEDAEVKADQEAVGLPSSE